jgi:hypothetical protein
VPSATKLWPRQPTVLMVGLASRVRCTCPRRSSTSFGCGCHAQPTFDEMRLPRTIRSTHNNLSIQHKLGVLLSSTALANINASKLVSALPMPSTWCQNTIRSPVRSTNLYQTQAWGSAAAATSPAASPPQPASRGIVMRTQTSRDDEGGGVSHCRRRRQPLPTATAATADGDGCHC